MSCCLSSPFFTVPLTSKVVPESIFAVGWPMRVILLSMAVEVAVAGGMTDCVGVDDLLAVPGVLVVVPVLVLAAVFALHAVKKVTAKVATSMTTYALRCKRDNAINVFPLQCVVLYWF